LQKVRRARGSARCACGTTSSCLGGAPRSRLLEVSPSSGTWRDVGDRARTVSRFPALTPYRGTWMLSSASVQVVGLIGNHEFRRIPTAGEANAMTISRPCAVLSVLALLAFAPLTSAWAASAPQPLTSCGEDVEGDVYLTGDLDCTGIGGIGVNLLKRAKLELRGFSIRNSEDFAVQCFKSCEIVGPGTISGSWGGVWAPYRLTITDVALVDNEVLGVASGNLRMKDCEVVGGRYGIRGGLKAKIVNSSVTGAAGSGIEIAASVPFIGPDACTRGRVTLVNSIVEGNGAAPLLANCAGNVCADISTCLAPKLDAASSCGTSYQYSGAQDWDVCTLD